MKKTVIRTCLATIAYSSLCNLAIAHNAALRVEEARPVSGEDRVIGACRFRIQNMFAGYLSIYTDSTPPTGIYHLPAVGPEAPNDKDLGIALGAKRIGDKWLQYDPSAEAPGLTPFDKNANPQTVTFKGKNWTGVGLTIDATTGDEERRPRVVSFCLIHKAKALCGNTPVAWLSNPKHNDLSMMKSILQSVVFFDSPTSISASDPIIREAYAKHESKSYISQIAHRL